MMAIISAKLFGPYSCFSSRSSAVNPVRGCRVFMAFCLLLLAAPPALAAEAALTAELPVDLLAQLNQAHEYVKDGNYEQARDLYEQTLAALQGQLGPEHPDIVAVRNQLAGVYESLGDDAKAKEIYERVLAVEERTLGPEHSDTLTTRHNLAGVYESLGDYAKAKEVYENVLAVWERTLGPEHPATLTTRHNLAVVYGRSGDYVKAKEVYEHVLAVRERTLGPEHPATLTTRNNLARVYGRLGDFAKAKEVYEDVLAVRERTLESGHPATLATRHNLAVAYHSLGGYAKAKEIYDHVLAVRERTLGPEHSDTLTTRHGLALVYKSLGDYVKAKEISEQVLAVRERTFGPEHPDTIAVRHSLAIVYQSLGDYTKAKEILEQDLAVAERILGSEHPETLATRHSLAVIYGRLGDYAKAKESFEHELAVRERARGEKHRDTLVVRARLAGVYKSLGDYTKAKEIYEHVLPIQEHTLGSEHPDTVTTRHNLAVAYKQLRNYTKAKELFEQALAVQERIFGPYHPSSARAYACLAQIFDAEGELAKAIFYAKRAVQGTQEQRRSQTEGNLDEALRRSYLAENEWYYHLLSELLIKANRPEEAQAVLRLLKNDELGALRAAAGPEDVLQPAVPSSALASGEERILLDEYAAAGGHLAALGKEQRALLEKAKNEDLSPREKARLKVLDAELMQANKDFRAFMDALPQRLQLASEQVKNDAGRLKNLESLRSSLRSLGAGVALVHTLSTEDALHIFLTTPDVLLVRSSPVGRKDLEKKVAELHGLLRQPGSDPRRAAKKMYDLILGPIADDVRAGEFRTLMFSLDGALRYIPMAALHDGEKWLVESYALAIFTEAARDKLLLEASFASKAMAFGMSEAKEGFSALPAVRGEIESIVREKKGEKGVLSGTRLLNADFTYAGLSEGLRKGTPVVHIASHFKFDPLNPKESFLLLGDGSKLSLSTLDTDVRLPFTDVDQLTLSACDTAFGTGKGNGREVEGFGVLAQERGARCVLASLWPVADASTSHLMRDFYRFRFSDKLNRAEALRQAQLALLQNTGKEDGSRARGLPLATSGKGDASVAARQTYPGHSHPYYWAPFILMGNWK